MFDETSNNNISFFLSLLLSEKKKKKKKLFKKKKYIANMNWTHWTLMYVKIYTNTYCLFFIS